MRSWISSGAAVRRRSVRTALIARSNVLSPTNHTSFPPIDWLADKKTGSPFALPGLYQPLSNIPLVSWLASRSSSNGIEQTHRHLNIGGIGHSLLGGIMVGYAHDREALRRREVTVKLGIHSRHMVPTKHNKQLWALRRACTLIAHRRLSLPY